MQEFRFTEIERENWILLEKMTSIMNPNSTKIQSNNSIQYEQLQHNSQMQPL